MSEKKQLTLSKFFAPVKKKGTYSFQTDEEKKEGSSKRVTEVTVSSPIKRSKHESSTNGDSHHSHHSHSKKHKSHDKKRSHDSSSHRSSGEERDKSDLPRKKHRHEGSTKTEEERVESKHVKSPKPEKSVCTNGVKSKLEAFRSVSDEEKGANASQSPPKSAPTSSRGLMKALPGMKLTPLEQQVVAIKNKRPDTVMFIECGYKYRFFGNDAEVAGKELNIFAHLDHNFMTASIPTYRLHVHVRRLVAKGYKVGVVKQTETAALKAAGANKTAPFERELTALYTRSTLIGEDVTPAAGGEGVGDGDISEGTTSMLLVVHEGKSSKGKSGTVGIAIVAIQPSTGDIIYDTFDDSKARSELWCRIDHIQPVEALVPESISSLTAKAITAATTRNDDCIRIERLREDKFDYSESLRRVCELFDGEEEKVKFISSLPPNVISCLGATVDYLAEFKLDRIMKMAGTITQYSEDKHHLRLSGATLRNLEVLVNGEDGGVKGSLLWALDKTQTKFGARLLRRWIIQPVRNKEEILERQDMIEEIMDSDSPILTALKPALQKLPDFERALTTIFHKKCSPHEFWLAVQGLSHLHAELSKVSGDLEESVRTPRLRTLLREVLDGLSNVHSYADNINEVSAKEGKKTSLLHDFSEFPEVVRRQRKIEDVEEELQELKPQIAKTLRLPAFNYTSVSGLEYLVEVKNAQLNAVPKNWAKLSSTKACCRFRSPEIEKHFTKLQQLREQLQADCNKAWLEILDKFSSHYQRHRESVRSLATLDCLLSLSHVAKAHGYCRPKIVECDDPCGAVLRIVGGQHPVVSQLKQGSEQYVANDTDLKTDGKRVMLVTGPNMGGKSCYMRQVALIALMAQTGSFVPAESVEMTILDGIYTRMGAADEIFSGQSTFMVEVGETADIMREATSRSLVILDELGRGTSTHDGVAVAMGALDYFLNKVKCLTVFVTHYLPLTEFEQMYPDYVGNYHMAFIVNEEDDDDGVDVVTFLYQLTSGSAGQSYGLNVARLAQVPHSILLRASEKSKDLENICKLRRSGKEMFMKVFGKNETARNLLKDLKHCEA